ncbi:Fe-S-cluster-containing hydrogenase subunit [Desulfocurvibacter africanus PCS]|uniref:Fe-S-cluster-containing hydrogenase subunit n=1 Tax=Desulfocurvibacter africanus PCS TaxID=1262666 RepID=M5Q2C4_DESAF|nr:Fe-S-cluster-containing hydrogenase subunit [Desulfocurvibacter africanus PCS]
MNRRRFMGLLSAAGLTAALPAPSALAAGRQFSGHPDGSGVLFDSERCMGCRKCEQACNEVNQLPAPDRPFDDFTVLEHQRRTTAKAITVVNRYDVPGREQPVFRKAQCFHCMEPACASACFVRAFQKTPQGPVTYDPSVCVGCRYCMVACPFNIPAYEYDEAFSPKVMKCTMCAPRLAEGKLPACVEICPKEALVFGKRTDLVRMAWDRVRKAPRRYAQHVYGEHEMGGTSWLLVTGVKPELVGLRTDLGTTPAGEYTAGALGAVPMVVSLWPVLLTGLYAVGKRKDSEERKEREAAVREAARREKNEAERTLSEFKAKADKEKAEAVEREVRKALSEEARKRAQEVGK